MPTPDQAPTAGDPRLDTTVRIGIATGTISVIGSVMIILVLLRSPKKLKSVYRRLVFGLSCMDIVLSFTYIAGGLLVPNDEGTWHSTNAIGNVTTCNIQGFMNYTGLMGSLLYSCSLSIYFVLCIVYSKNENLIQKSIEPFFHAFSILIPFGSGIYLMATNHFNGAGFTCWISAYPSYCKENENVDCTRGNHAIRYQFYFLYIPVVIVSFIFFTCMMHLICSIRNQYRKMTKYGSNKIIDNIKRKRQSVHSASPINAKIAHRSSMVNTKPSKKSQNEMKQTTIQAILYISAMALALMFPSCLLPFKLKRDPKIFVLWELQNFFLPLLGFYNFFIFIRPRVVITMQAKPDLSFLRAFIIAIVSKEVKPPQQRKSVWTSRRSTVVRRSLLDAPLEIDAKNVANQIQKEEEEEEEEEERGEVEVEKGTNDNNDETEESKEEIVAYQSTLYGRENNAPTTNIGLNTNDNNDETEESKEEIVAYQSTLYGRENNAPPTNIGLNQISNDSSLSYSDDEHPKLTGANGKYVDLTDDYNSML